MLLAAASCAPLRAPEPSSKLDRALNEWVAHPTATVRVLIRTRGGNLVAATVDAPALRAMNSDSNVERVSSDARVRSLGTSYLTQDALLNTEALLPRRVQRREHRRRRRRFRHHSECERKSRRNLRVHRRQERSESRRARPVRSWHARRRPHRQQRNHVNRPVRGHRAWREVLRAERARPRRIGVHERRDQRDQLRDREQGRARIDVINLSLGHPIYEPAATDPLVQAVENAVAPASSSSCRPATSAATRPRTSSATPASHRPATRRCDYRRRDRHVQTASAAATTWSRGTARAARRGTTDSRSRTSSRQGRIWCPTCRRRARSRRCIQADSSRSSGTTNLTKLSGTSMSAGVVSGVVALVIEASRTNYPGALLTPNAVKAILQYTSLPLANADILTQGAGALNAAGAIALAAAIDPSQPVGSWWLATGVTRPRRSPASPLRGVSASSGETGSIWGNQIFNNDPAWALARRVGRPCRLGRPRHLGRQHGVGWQPGGLGQPGRVGRQPHRPKLRQPCRLGRSFDQRHR